MAQSRGRRASSAQAHGWENELDRVLLPKLAACYRGQDWMLVTSDDAMPAEHGRLIQSLGQLTIATLDGDFPEGMDQEEYKCEVIHRWAHTMQGQPGHTIVRYGLKTHHIWTPKKKKPVARRTKP